jgi:hypothetical protein
MSLREICQNLEGFVCRGPRTQDLHEQMDCLKVCQLVVISVNTDTEEEAGVASIHNLVVPKL